jgi:hypothetical protein
MVGVGVTLGVCVTVGVGVVEAVGVEVRVGVLVGPTGALGKAAGEGLVRIRGGSVIPRAMGVGTGALRPPHPLRVTIAMTPARRLKRRINWIMIGSFTWVRTPQRQNSPDGLGPG